MPETIQIKKIKYETEENAAIYNVYLQEYNISILIRYQSKEDEKDKRSQQETKNNLESILKIIKEKLNNIEKQNERPKNKDVKIISKSPCASCGTFGCSKCSRTEVHGLSSTLTSLEEKLKEKDDEKYIFPNRYKSDKNNNLNDYFQYLASQNTNHHINQKSGAHVFYVPSSYLPPNVLGMYVPDKHTIYIANDLPEKEKEFVYFHEEYHSIHGAGEQEADNYAFQRTGYNLRAA